MDEPDNETMIGELEHVEGDLEESTFVGIEYDSGSYALLVYSYSGAQGTQSTP